MRGLQTALLITTAIAIPAVAHTQEPGALDASRQILRLEPGLKPDHAGAIRFIDASFGLK